MDAEQQIAALEKYARMITLPNTNRNKGGAEFDAGSCIKAVTVLRLTAPVEIKWSSGTRRKGAHYWRDGRHVVTISTYLGGDEANMTLWHELTHAVQTERVGEEKFWADYRMFGRSGRAYETNPYEIEANQVMHQFASVLRLTKP
jgi:hypothetical protein